MTSIIQYTDLIASAASPAARTQPSLDNEASFAHIMQQVQDTQAQSAAAPASDAQQAEAERIAARLAEIKAKPNVQRTQEEHAFVIANDSRMAQIADAPIEQRTADEVDYMQKAGGFVNTMAMLSTEEKVLYDELVAAGDTEAAEAMNMIALTRHAFGGDITLPNGTTFNPRRTEITAETVQNLFRHSFGNPDNDQRRAFDALVAALERREVQAKTA